MAGIWKALTRHAASTTVILVLCLLLGVALVMTVVLLLFRRSRRQEAALSALRLMLKNRFDEESRQNEADRQDMAQAVREVELSVGRLQQRMEGGQKKSGQEIDQIKWAVEEKLDAWQQTSREEMEKTREEMLRSVDAGREEMVRQREQVQTLLEAQKAELVQTREAVHRSMQRMGEASSSRLLELQESISRQLGEAMDARLEASFAQVSGRLEQVSRSLTEIASLAGSVDALSRLMGDQQPLGLYGEAQLGNLLAQMLAPQQYAKQATLVPGREIQADYAVVMPGREGEQTVQLPMDASLPLREYHELRRALEKGSHEDIEAARNLLSSSVHVYVRRLGERLIAPPYTTDYAILFLQSEGLYAEVLRMGDLAEKIRRESGVVLAGPATLAALLSSLQLGFRSIAIEQHTGEIVATLGAVRSDFSRYASTLEKTRNRLRRAAEDLELVQRQGEDIARRLESVPEVPAKEPLRRVEGQSYGDAFDLDEEDDWD